VYASSTFVLEIQNNLSKHIYKECKDESVT
jgi:hypothetical protein